MLYAMQRENMWFDVGENFVDISYPWVCIYRGTYKRFSLHTSPYRHILYVQTAAAATCWFSDILCRVNKDK